MIYQRISLATTEPVGDPGALPFAVANWSGDLVSDLSRLPATYGLNDAGFWPVVDDIPAYDPATETVVAGDLRKDAAGKRFVRQWTVETIPITTDQINAERQRRLLAGMDFNGIYVTGDDTNRANLSDLAFGASLRLGAGDTSTITTFRDGNNADHKLTPPELLGLWQLAATHVSMLYAKSWELKAMSPIPADFTDDSYWSA